MQITNNNVSAFQFEEEKKSSDHHTIDASSLRIPAEGVFISDSSEADFSQPIMHLMQIHQ